MSLLVNKKPKSLQNHRHDETIQNPNIWLTRPFGALIFLCPNKSRHCSRSVMGCLTNFSLRTWTTFYPPQLRQKRQPDKYVCWRRFKQQPLSSGLLSLLRAASAASSELLCAWAGIGFTWTYHHCAAKHTWVCLQMGPPNPVV
jgi:hypothetical protein